MKRRVFYGILLGLLAVNLFVGAQVYFSNVQAAEKDDALPNLRLFSTVLDRVRQEYVDGEKLSYQELIRGALKGMLNTLDPHSEFMEPAKYDDLKKDTQGEFGGVGIHIEMKNNYVTVVAPMEDTPGFRAGIISGDRIVKIDGKNAERLSLPEAVKRLRGAPDTEVTLTTYRPSTGEFKDHTLTRAKIKVDTIKDINSKREFPLSEDNVGYIRLVQFGEATSTDLDDAMRTTVDLDRKPACGTFTLFAANALTCKACQLVGAAIGTLLVVPFAGTCTDARSLLGEQTAELGTFSFLHLSRINLST